MLNKIKFRIRYLSNKDKFLLLFLPIIIVLALGIFIYSNINTFKEISLHKEMNTYMEKFYSKSKITNELVLDDKTFKLEYDNKDLNTLITLTEQNNVNEYIYFDNEWFIKIPEEFKIENEEFNYIKVNKDDLLKDTDLENANIQGYIEWLQSVNNFITKALIKNSSYEDIKVLDNGNGYEFTIPTKNSDIVDKIFKNILSSLDLNKEVHNSFKDKITKIIKEENVDTITVKMTNDTVEINLLSGKDSILTYKINENDIKINIEENEILELNQAE